MRRSSPVLPTTTRSAGSWTRSSPRRNLAAPTPPASATSIWAPSVGAGAAPRIAPGQRRRVSGAGSAAPGQGSWVRWSADPGQRAGLRGRDIPGRRCVLGRPPVRPRLVAAGVAPAVGRAGGDGALGGRRLGSGRGRRRRGGGRRRGLGGRRLLGGRVRRLGLRLGRRGGAA